MTPFVQSFSNVTPGEKCDLRTAERVQEFASRLGLTGTINAVRQSADVDPVWHPLSELNANGLDPSDVINYVTIYDRWPDIPHNCARAYKILMGDNGSDQQARLQMFTADIAVAISNLNPNAGADQAILLADLLAHIAKPALADVFAGLK